MRMRTAGNEEGASSRKLHLSTLHAAYVLQEVDRAMLTPCTILDQAGHQAIFWVSGNYQRRDIGLAQRFIRFESTLPADKIVRRITRLGTAGDSYGFFQTQLTNVLDHLAETAPAAYARINNGDQVDRDHFDALCRKRCHYAAALNGTRAVIW